MLTLPYRPCVGIMLINEDQQIFTAERIDTPGAWQMPQGGIDEGENPLDAARRELEEETCIPASGVTVLKQTKDWLTYDLPDHLVGRAWGGRYRGQKQQWFLMKLDIDTAAVDLRTEHQEFSRWKWSTRTELVNEIVPFKKHVYAQLVTEFLG